MTKDNKTIQARAPISGVEFGNDEEGHEVARIHIAPFTVSVKEYKRIVGSIGDDMKLSLEVKE